MSKVLVFSIATYGYDVVRDQCIQSHQEYSKKHGYDYFCINKIPQGYSNDMVVWTKLPLILEWLKHYDWVVFLDADCKVQDNCPRIESLKSTTWSNKHIYFSTWFSWRINSGVIITHKHESVRILFLNIIKNKNKELPKEDFVGWSFGGGENGHVIHYCKNADIVEIIDKKRNNNSDPLLNDYIRHYSAGGPMRAIYSLSCRWKLQSILISIKTFIKKLKRKTWLSQWYKHESQNSFENLVDYCIKNYPFKPQA